MANVNELKIQVEQLDIQSLVALEAWLSECNQRKTSPHDCFVIMPFSMTKDGRSADYWTAFFENFLKPSLAACGYHARRSEATSENIVGKLMEDLAWAGLVLAVLTDHNANVWYELGVRHSLQRGRTLSICQDDQANQVPFDLKHHGFILYSNSLDRSSFITALSKQLPSVRDDTSDSPVSEFLNSGLYYCINRAMAARKLAVRKLRACSKVEALEEAGRINSEWRCRELQLTIVEAGRIVKHAEMQAGVDANECWEDQTIDGRSLYPHMKSDGQGLRLASIRARSGRVTAIAFQSIPEHDWLIVVEGHITQGAL